MTEEKKTPILKCPKCETRMVRQSDIYIVPRFEREPSGRVNLSLTDDVTSRIYVCPKCHYMEFYYERV